MNLKNNLELKAWAILCQVADPEDPIADAVLRVLAELEVAEEKAWQYDELCK